MLEELNQVLQHTHIFSRAIQRKSFGLREFKSNKVMTQAGFKPTSHVTHISTRLNVSGECALTSKPRLYPVPIVL